MAIGKKPLGNQNAILADNNAEKAAVAFIGKAEKAKEPEVLGKTPVLFRFKNDFLVRIDAAAKKHELPRQAWVRTIIAQALEAEGF